MKRALRKSHKCSKPQDRSLAIRTQAEVAAILTARGCPTTQQDVAYYERRALEKLKPFLRAWARDWGLLLR